MDWGKLLVSDFMTTVFAESVDGILYVLMVLIAVNLSIH